MSKEKKEKQIPTHSCVRSLSLPHLCFFFELTVIFVIKAQSSTQIRDFAFSACSTSAVGVAVRAVVPDHRFTASSYYAVTYKPELARLNGPNGWGPKSRDLSQNPWLQIDLGNSRFVCAIATQGFDGSALEWTTKYKLNISLDNRKWQVYQERGTDKAGGFK